MDFGIGAGKSAVKKAAKKAGRGAAKAVRGAAGKVGKQLPGYGEMTVDSKGNVRQNKAGKTLRGMTRGK